jgi:hypothetical protein
VQIPLPTLPKPQVASNSCLVELQLDAQNGPLFVLMGEGRDEGKKKPLHHREWQWTTTTISRSIISVVVNITGG